MSFGNPQVISSAGSSLQPTGTGPPPPGFRYSPNSALLIPKSAPVAMVNGTPNIASFVIPNDGVSHAIIMLLNKIVTVLEVGGQVRLNYTNANGAAVNTTCFAGAQAAGSYNNATIVPVMADPGQTVTLQQSTALTGGASSIYGQILLL